MVTVEDMLKTGLDKRDPIRSPDMISTRPILPTQTYVTERQKDMGMDYVLRKNEEKKYIP